MHVDIPSFFPVSTPVVSDESDFLVGGKMMSLIGKNGTIRSVQNDRRVFCKRVLLSMELLQPRRDENRMIHDVIGGGEKLVERFGVFAFVTLIDSMDKQDRRVCVLDVTHDLERTERD